MKCPLCPWEGSNLTGHIIEVHGYAPKPLPEAKEAIPEAKEVPPPIVYVPPPPLEELVGRRVAHHVVADKYGTIISTRHTPGAFRETEVFIRWDPKWEEEPEWWDLGNVALLPSSQPEAKGAVHEAKQEVLFHREWEILGEVEPWKVWVARKDKEEIVAPTFERLKELVDERERARIPPEIVKPPQPWPERMEKRYTKEGLRRMFTQLKDLLDEAEREVRRGGLSETMLLYDFPYLRAVVNNYSLLYGVRL